MKSLILSLMAVSFVSATPLIADDVEELIKDHREFAISIYPVLNTDDANLVFSPYSIATCLSMVFVGARGETATQMEKALHLELDRKTLPKVSASLSKLLALKKKEDSSYQLNVANAVWVDQGIFLLTDFRYAIQEQFNSKLGTLNFSQPASALTTINNWVSGETQNKIPNLLSPNDIDELTQLVLTNAVYFQGTWAQSFDVKATQNALFHPQPETNMTVKMLRKVLLTPYFENDLMQAVALPFIGTAASGGKLALVVLLPKSADNFSNMFQELNESFAGWISSLKYQQVDLKIPKFNLSSRYDLNDPLKQLGMEDAFDSEANFVGIDGMRDLFLNKVVHQAFFDLDENGVTAAAATGGSMNVTSINPQEPPALMNIDHPFLFFIVDLNTQAMLFMGKITEPSIAK